MVFLSGPPLATSHRKQKNRSFLRRFIKRSFSMFIDITVAVILILFIFIGDRKGFLRTFISTFGWGITLAGSYFLKEPLESYLSAHTGIKNFITTRVTDYITFRMNMAANDGVSADRQGGIASTLRNAADTIAQNTAEQTAQPIADAIFGILTLLLLFIGLRISMYTLESIGTYFCSKDRPLRSVNSIFGMIFSMIKGSILSYVLILLLFLISVIISNEFLLDQLGTSFLCQLILKTGLVPNIFATF